MSTPSKYLATQWNLIDLQKKGQQPIEGIYKRKLLNKQQVITFADFTEGSEADIEDMFNPEFYLGLVNGEFDISLNLSELSWQPETLELKE